MLTTFAVSLATTWVDLGHALSEKDPTFEGQPAWKLENADGPGYFAHRFCGAEHQGTHVDAPAHFKKGGVTVDKIAASELVSEAVVIDVQPQVKKDTDFRIGIAELVQWERKNGRIPERALVLGRTGWATRFSRGEAYRNADKNGVLHFPGFSVEAVAWLLKERPTVVGIGIDTLSIDHGPSQDFAAHKLWLGAGKYAIENLADLSQLPARGAQIMVAPLKIAGGTGAPARVWATTSSRP